METLIEIIAELRAENKELETYLAERTESSSYWYKKCEELVKKYQALEKKSQKSQTID